MSAVPDQREEAARRAEAVLANAEEATKAEWEADVTTAFSSVEAAEEAWNLARDNLALLSELSRLQRDELRETASWERLAEHFTDRLVALWHDGDAPSGSLAEWMGLSDEQYAAWVECRFADVSSSLAALRDSRSGVQQPDVRRCRACGDALTANELKICEDCVRDPRTGAEW